MTNFGGCQRVQGDPSCCLSVSAWRFSFSFSVFLCLCKKIFSFSTLLLLQGSEEKSIWNIKPNSHSLLGLDLEVVNVLVSGNPTWCWSVSACRRLPPSAFNQSSISSSCCFPLNSVVPSPADVLLVQTARKSNSPFERHKGFKAGETFWKVANPSFHFAQTPRPGGSRGLDGAIGNLCHKGIMCTESTISQ